jgi:hypothetical protein
VKKAGQSFLQFRGAFKECIELMSYSGIELPDIYVRLQFVDGMATDKRYDRAMWTYSLPDQSSPWKC